MRVRLKYYIILSLDIIKGDHHVTLKHIKPKIVRYPKFQVVETEVIILPLYLYDHSGITMSTSPFSCPWDSGQVGFIYVSVEKAKKEYGWKRMTKTRRKKIEDHLRNEMEVYDQYLTGDVYGFKILDEDGEVNDSCWGFFGSDHEASGMMDEIRGHIQWEKEYRVKQESALNVCMAL